MRTGVVACVALLTSACATSLAQADRPALIITPTAASRAELLGIVRAALNNAPLTLADSALTQDSVLLIERVPRIDAAGLLINGREVEMPERFLLSIQASRCVLTHERTRKRWSLPQTRCRARP